MKSYERSLHSMQSGIFDWEIVGVPSNKGLITKDEEPGNFKKKKIFSLKPVFEENGTITGANASKINDGACGLLLANQKIVEKFGLKPLAEIVSFADAELAPERFNETPLEAIKKLLAKNKLKIEDIDFWEVNEAFSVTPLVTSKLLGIDINKINVHGGAVSLGHPIGMSGARIILSLLNVLRMRGGKLGMATICNGGGGASAILVRNMQ